MAKTDGTKVCKHCQTEISKKAKVCPQCRKKQGGGIGKIILLVFLALIVLAVIGSNSGNSTKEFLPEDERVYLTETEIDNAYANPNSFKEKYVKIGGLVFGEPEINEDVIYFQLYADTVNLEKNTIVAFYGNEDISNGDYIMIDGVISGSTSYKNLLGGTLNALTIETDSVEKSNYIDCCSPTIKTVDTNKTIEQYGYSITIEKIEFSKTETRLYISVSNNGSHNFSLYDSNIKIIQNGRQYEYEYNYNADYPEINTDLLPGTVTSGIVSFPPLDSETSLKINCDAYCDDWEIDLKDYTFEF